MFLISWDRLSYPLSEFDGGSTDSSALLEMRIREKHATIPGETGGRHVYFIERFDTIIGAFEIRVKLYSKIDSSSGRSSYIFNMNNYRRLDAFGSEDDRLICWNANFYLYPWPVGGNQSLAIDAVCFRGRPSMSVCGTSGALCGLYRLRALENGSPSREPQQGRENPKPGSGNEKAGGKPSYPPVWFRIPLALFLGIGSNGVLAWGLSLSDDRHIGRAVLCALGIAMMLAGLSLALMLGIPATWGWWV
jgi:hypothetical protein